MLPPLREVIRAHGLAADRRFGQNFLLDLNLTAAIVRGAGPLAGVHVVEIGPGPGGLTRALAAAGPASLTVIERDRRFLPALQPLADQLGERLRIVEADALEVDAASLTPAPRAIIANLPYNIASPLLVGWLRQIEAFTSLTLMFQKEVAERLTASPGGGTYGRLSVLAQWRAETRRVLDLPPAAFTPPPKVASRVVRLSPHPPDLSGATPRQPAFTSMERVLAAAFGQRRKMLRGALRALGPPSMVEALLAAAEAAPEERAERLSVAQFCKMACAFEDATAQLS